MSIPTISGNAYFVNALDGSDSNDGRSAARPWKTIARVNAAQELQPGDGVFFNRGHQFAGTLQVLKSGTAARPILYSAYGVGAKPVITGFATLSGWTAAGNGVWEAECAPCGSALNLVTVNGTVQRMGRYPNTSYLQVRSHVSNSSITGSEAHTVNWTGGELVIKKNQWIIDRARIQSVSGANVAYSSSSTYAASDNFGYFFQNHPDTLDQFGEWYYNPSTKKLRVFFGIGANPAAHVVKAAALAKVVNANDRSHVVIDNLALQGSHLSTISVGNTTGVRVANTDIAYSGTDAISGMTAAAFTLEASSIAQTLNNGVFILGATSTVLRGNVISDTGMIPGLGQSGDGTYSAVLLNQVEAVIESNTVVRSGYNGISFFYPQGNGIIIRNNLVDGCTLVKTDGACVYSWHSPGNLAPNTAPKEIIGNVLLNAVGSLDGIDPAARPISAGIYLDDGVSHGRISGNTIAHAMQSGIYVHNAHSWQITGNTLFNNGSQLEAAAGNANGVDAIRNLDVSGNVFAGKTDKQLLFNAFTVNGDSDIAALGRFSNNRYALVMGSPLVLQTNGPNGQGYSLGGWQSKFGFDLSSTGSPVNRASYVVNSIIGTNKVANGDFNLNVDGIWPYNAFGNADLSRQTGRLDGSALQIAFPRPSGASNTTIVFSNVGTVAAGKTYLVRFSALGGRSKSIGVYLRQAINPWHSITPVQYTQIGSSRTEAQLVFTVPSTQEGAVVLELPDEETVWIDNLSVHEASISPLNPDGYVRFDYNATAQVKTLRLDRDDYVDAAGNPVRDLTLAPYTLSLIHI